MSGTHIAVKYGHSVTGGNAALRRAVNEAVEEGLCVVPPREDGSKAPLGQWRQYRTERPSRDQLRHWYSDGLSGIGIVCGAVSGNLESVDFETKDIYAQVVTLAQETGLQSLVERVENGYLEESPAGIHWLWRCSEIAGNTKLARGADEKILIETRGEGGYIIVAPSSGPVHPTGSSYNRVNGSFSTIPRITIEEREALLELARSFDQSTRPEEATEAGRPGDDYNNKASWSGILPQHGWTAVFTVGDVTHWRRPGKSQGTSATTGYGESDLLYVFSSNTVFAAEKSYSKFAAYTTLEHQGDYRKAAAELATRGFGSAALVEAPGSSLLTTQGFAFVSWDTLVTEPEEEVAWVWEGVLATSSTSLLVSKPKVGKSTFARNIALLVASGGEFLGRVITPGPVLYLSLLGEGKRSEIRNQTVKWPRPQHPFLLYVGATPLEPLAALRAAVAQYRPALVVIDTLFRFRRVTDTNDYAEMVTVTQELASISVDYGCHIMANHHAPKESREISDSALGSTSIFGGVDTMILLRMQDGRRTLETIQRHGVDVAETVLEYDADTDQLISAGSVEELDLNEACSQVLVACAEPASRSAIIDTADGKARTITAAIRHLLQSGELERFGSGSRGDPFTYKTRSRVQWQ